MVTYIKSHFSKILVGGVLVLALSFILGPSLYASFIQLNSPFSQKDGFGYGFGYGDAGFGFGYGYGYSLEYTGLDGYGFSGADGSAIITSVVPTQTTLTVNYLTTYIANHRLDYGTTNSFGSHTPATQFDSTGAHSVIVSGLTCGTTYYFTLGSQDVGGNVWSTPTAAAMTSACTTSSGSGNGGAVLITGLSNGGNGAGGQGGGSGNGGNYNKPADCSTGILFSPSTGKSCIFLFTKDLEKGMDNGDVLHLQIFLNGHGAQVASKGAGSPGNEVTHFGPATQKALAKYQKSNKITPSAGYFGSKTRKFVNAILEAGK